MWLPSGRLARGRAPESARRRAEIGRDPLRVVDGVQVRLTAVGAQEGDHRRRPAVAIEIAADRSIYAPGRPAGHDPVIAKKIMAADGLIPFRHDDELRDDGMVDHWRPDARANPRNEPPKGRASGDHGSFYIDRYHDGVAARFRDPLRDARDRRPGAEADEQVVDAPKHLDEFAAGELVVPARAVRVPVLIRPVGAVDFRHKLGDPGEAAEQEASRAVGTVYLLHPIACLPQRPLRRAVDIRIENGNEPDSQASAEKRHREREITGGRLDHDGMPGDLPTADSLAQDPVGGPVLDAAARICTLHFREQLKGGVGQPPRLRPRKQPPYVLDAAPQQCIGHSRALRPPTAVRTPRIAEIPCRSSYSRAGYISVPRRARRPDRNYCRRSLL